MKKIGILTLHSAINYGAFLQAFALQRTLNLQGYDARIIELENNKWFERLMNIKCKRIPRACYNYRLQKAFDQVDDRLIISTGKRAFFDAVVVGSDELWNLENSTFKHQPEYFGENVDSSRIISYAVSANRLTYDKFREITRGRVDFSKFTALSVRDESTYDLVRMVSGRDAEYTLDPTLLYPNWESEVVPCQEKDFILLYNFTTYDKEKECIIRFAKQENKRIISVGSYNPWCDLNLCKSPFEFLGYVQAADYVVTSSFHGTVFSLIFNKRFVVFPQGKKKVLDLMRRFQILDRDATDVIDIRALFYQEIDFDYINRYRAEGREHSIAWLNKAICD